MGSAENSRYTCNRKLSLQRPKHPTSTKIFKKFGPWPAELPLPAVRAKRYNIPRGTRHHHLSSSLSSALQPLQRAEPQPPLLCPKSQAPATHRRVEKLPLSPALPRNCLHEDRTVPHCPQLPKESSIFMVGRSPAFQPLAKPVNSRAAFQGQSSAVGPVPCPMHDF